jgi:hypothetical protein
MEKLVQTPKKHTTFLFFISLSHFLSNQTLIHKFPHPQTIPDFKNKKMKTHLDYPSFLPLTYQPNRKALKLNTKKKKEKPRIFPKAIFLRKEKADAYTSSTSPHFTITRNFNNKKNPIIKKKESISNFSRN